MDGTSRGQGELDGTNSWGRSGSANSRGRSGSAESRGRSGSAEGKLDRTSGGQGELDRTSRGKGELLLSLVPSSSPSPPLVPSKFVQPTCSKIKRIIGKLHNSDSHDINHKFHLILYVCMCQTLSSSALCFLTLVLCAHIWSFLFPVIISLLVPVCVLI